MLEKKKIHCTCPYKECVRYGKCGECKKHHEKAGSSPTVKD